MKKPLSLAAAAFLCSCATGPLSFPIDDSDPRVIRRESQDEERRAKEALADIQRKVDSGSLPKIQFEFDRDEITPESFATLDLIAELLLKNPRLKLIALAHTDSLGTEEYNLDLSERRARAVKSTLVKKGVAPPSIRFKGMGFAFPLADNSTEEGRAKNRRVEFRVTYRDWEAVY
ncbi:MAG: OmpA family protein [Elusimicrobiota bacterium]